jgi:hypothetical protein
VDRARPSHHLARPGSVTGHEPRFREGDLNLSQVSAVFPVISALADRKRPTQARQCRRRFVPVHARARGAVPNVIEVTLQRGLRP